VAIKTYTLEDIKALYKDPKKLEAVPLHHLKQIDDYISGLTRGHGSDDLPPSPGDLALKLGTGKMRWQMARHLQLINEKLVALVKHKLGTNFLMICVPPGHGKSHLCDIWLPLWALADNPTLDIIIAGYGAGFAREWGMTLRNLVLEHTEYLNICLSPSSMAADEWKLTAGGSVKTVGVGGDIMGRHPDILILDDLIKSRKEADSPTYRKSTWEWVQTSAVTRLKPNGVMVVIGTPWHEDDILARIQRESESGSGIKFDILRLPALAQEDDPLGRALDEPLWPEHWPDDPNYTQRKKGLSRYDWAALYQVSPSPEGGGILKRTDWRGWTKLPLDPDQWIQSWDFGLKDNQTSNYTVGQVWCRKGAEFYLVDATRGQFSTPEVINEVRRFSGRYPQAVAKLFEDTAMGPSVKAMLQREIPGIIPIKPTSGKRARVATVEPVLNANNLYVPQREDGTQEEWVKDFIEECAQFKGVKGDTDDQVDAFTQAITHMLPAGWLSISKQHQEATRAPIGKSSAEIFAKQIHSQLKSDIDRAGRKFNHARAHALGRATFNRNIKRW